jgi:hypothetical protein
MPRWWGATRTSPPSGRSPIAIDSRNATRALTETLPLTSRLQTVFAGRISTLPARTRHALLMAVLDGTGDLTVLRYGQPGSEGDDLVPADQAQLISCDGATARFRSAIR